MGELHHLTQPKRLDARAELQDAKALARRVEALALEATHGDDRQDIHTTLTALKLVVMLLGRMRG